MAPLITLSTDFGTRDAYLAELKGVLLSEGPPGLSLIDLSHELAPFDIHAAALFVQSALPRFPSGTIHLAVVDPGVGSARRALIIERGDMLLVGPDNGLFSYLFDVPHRVYAIEPARLGQRAISSTFHGRDVFAPVAARLSAGASPSAFGHAVDSYQRVAFPMVDISGDTLHGRVLHVDRFGNVITNVARNTLRGFARDQQLTIVVGERSVHGLVDHYAQVEPGELLALYGSTGLLEIALREGDAASLLGAAAGEPVRVTRRAR